MRGPFSSLLCADGKASTSLRPGTQVPRELQQGTQTPSTPCQVPASSCRFSSPRWQPTTCHSPCLCLVHHLSYLASVSLPF